MPLLKERLLFRRHALNLSQAALAERSGVSERAIVAYEAGTSVPTSTRLERLAKGLQVSTLWLMGAEDPNAPVMLAESTTPYASQQLDLSLLSADALESVFKSLAAQLTESDEPERTRILEAVNSVNAERRRRKRGKLIQPPLSSEEQQKLLAAGLKHAGIGHETGDKSGSGQPSGAGEPPSHKPSPPGASGHPTKAPRPAREEQD